MTKTIKLFAAAVVMALAGEAWAAAAPQSLPEFNLPGLQQVIQKSKPQVIPIQQTGTNKDAISFTGRYSAHVKNPLEANGVREGAESAAEQNCAAAGFDCQGNSESHLTCLLGYCTATAISYPVPGNYATNYYDGFVVIETNINIADDNNFFQLETQGAYWAAVHDAMNICRAAGNQQCSSNGVRFYPCEDHRALNGKWTCTLSGEATAMGYRPPNPNQNDGQP